MNWYDPLVSDNADGKFGAVRDAVDLTPSSRLSWYATPFFGWLAWTALLAAVVVVRLAAIIPRCGCSATSPPRSASCRPRSAYLAHDDVVERRRSARPLAGRVCRASSGSSSWPAAGMTAVARPESDGANRRSFLERIMSCRPGLPLAVLGVVLRPVRLLNDCWFAPRDANTDFANAGDALRRNRPQLPRLAVPELARAGVLFARRGRRSPRRHVLRNVIARLAAGAVVGPSSQ